MDNILRLLLLYVITSQLLASQISLEPSNNKDITDSRDWGPWTGWSVCSENCGYGTAYRIRQCHVHHNRHRSSSVCQGQSKQYKLCILKNCTHAASDYRTAECAKHNNVLYGQQKYTWIPYINSVSPCELSCKSVGFGYYARFQKTVADFVICDDRNTAVCIQGQCVKSGCDGILDSGSQVDRCGVCDGDGTSCQLIRGIFTRMYLTHQGYNVITTIPAGARSINITEMGRSNNHLALSTVSGYFLNGNMRLQAEGSIKGAGTTFIYSRSTGQNCPGECLIAAGPLTTSLRVEIIYFGRNPGIYYDFTLPQEETHSIINSMTSAQDVASSSGLSSLSSKGPEERVNHQNDADKIATRADIIPRIKHGKSPVYIPDTESKNPRQQLHISSRVSSPKGSSHYQARHPVVNNAEHIFRSNHQQQSGSAKGSPSRDSSHDSPDHLRNENTINTRLHEPVDPASRAFLESPKDQFHVPGENGSVEYKHYYHTNAHDNIGDIPMSSPFDDDSEESDGRRRELRPSLASSSYVHDTRYAELKSTIHHDPPTRSSSLHNDLAQPLQNQHSRTSSNTRHREYSGHDNLLASHVTNSQLYSWRISGFTACSEPCGGGLQETRVVCVKGDSQVEVMDENCIQSIKPESTTIVCNNQPCEANWDMGEWDACSVTCGRGLQERTVECKQKISPTLTLSVSASACPQPQPLPRQFCQLDPCFSWRVSEWSKCSSECGFGQRTRIISCANGTRHRVNESLCSQNKPSAEEICDMGSCAQGWFHTKWSQECSSKCGRGYYSRQVFCSSADGTKLDENKCGGLKNKPREHKMCKVTKPCGGQWFTGAWSQCSATCGSNVYRHRDVLCIKHHGKMINQVVKENNCVSEDKPPHTEPCGPFPACKPEWFVMSWSECSATCGTGIKTREVKCLDASFASSADCNKDLKPSRRQPCNTQPCPVKHAAPSEAPDNATNEALQMDGLASANDHPVCKDNQNSRWCQLAKQARLCNYPHYRKICCHTCRKLDPKHL